MYQQKTAPQSSATFCLYLRVSTGRQAESDLSIPDQRNQLHSWVQARGGRVAAEYVDPGETATDDNRPEFQRMIECACAGDRPYDIILVHSYSRFMRDAFSLEMYIRKLEKAGVRLISVTQELGDDPAQVLMRQVIGLFDEYQSRENGKHVLRAMKENAKQGFYNGSPVPLGYRTSAVEQRGARIKKKLIVDPVEAETVKLIFKLYRLGEGASGSMGVKAIAVWLNERGYRTRRGGRFGVSVVHKILQNKAYIGQSVFNQRNSKTQRLKSADEHVVVEIPAIISRSDFDAVAHSLKARNPNVSPPRSVTGPILLTGLAVCGSCGGAMTLRTGTSKSGIVHRYYACSTCARQGKAACTGRSIPMGKLDDLVTRHLADQLFQPDRLAEILASIFERRAENALEVDRRVAALQADVAEADEKLSRLYKLVEDGVAEIDDLLKERIANLKDARSRSSAALERIRAQAKAPATFGAEAIERFGRVMRDSIATGSVPFRKAYIQAVVDRIEVGDGTIRIIGEKSTLEQALAGKISISGGVRRFVPKWRAISQKLQFMPALNGRIQAFALG